jgi:hypothetical protein
LQALSILKAIKYSKRLNNLSPINENHKENIKMSIFFLFAK